MFINGLMDHYYPEGRSFAVEYSRAMSSIDEWEKAVKKYELDGALLSVDWLFTDCLRHQPGWEIVYEDEGAVLFEKTEVRND